MRALFLLLMPVLANAGGIETTSQANVGDQTINTGSSNALGFAHSLGDVDINDCLASTQWGTILVSAQKVVLNLWCAGEVFDAKGLYQMGAIMRCDIPEISRHFQDRGECLAANTVTSMPAVAIPDEHIEEEEDWHEEQLQMQQGYEDRIAKLEQRLSRPAPRPQVIERTVVEQQPLLTREMAESLKVKKDE